MKTIKQNLAGILLCILIAAAATFLSSLHIGSFSFEIIGAPVFAILTGMLATLAAPKLSGHTLFVGGIRFTSKKILQWAVIILGFSMNLGTVVKVGGKSLPIIISTISISLITAFVMMKVLKIDSKIACLIGVGSSICGGSAIAATAPVIEADDEEVAQSISVIFLFNVLAALIFPSLGHAIGLGSEGFAVFAGTAVNDTSSVTAAASTAEGIYGIDGILSSAVTVKLTRTLAIIPITLALALYRTRKAKNQQGTGEGYSIKKIFPFFILFFAAASLITTIMGVLPESALTAGYTGAFVPSAKWLAKFFIAMAMGAIGLNTNIVKLIKNGKKPILLGLCCWTLITATSLLMQLATGIYSTEL
ncbi:MAG: putative sulfate exporter family transporter [Oscillospiraceae bacterium]|nr:putative sulfate exporter family transporter [Oscillospiraceae bacterium]